MNEQQSGTPDSGVVTEALKPCPWCECDRIETRLIDGVSRVMWEAFCDRCYASGPAMNVTEAEAVAAWNRRP